MNDKIKKYREKSVNLPIVVQNGRLIVNKINPHVNSQLKEKKVKIKLLHLQLKKKKRLISQKAQNLVNYFWVFFNYNMATWENKQLKKMLLQETESGEGLVDEDSEFESSSQVNITLIGWLI